MSRLDSSILLAALISVTFSTGCESTPSRWYDVVARDAEAMLDAAGPDDDLTQEVKWDTLPSREEALSVLLWTDEFTDWAIGANCVTPIQTKAFSVLLAHRDAARVFRLLLRSGRAASQLYALCGLYVVDRPFFEKAVEPFKTDGRTVVHQVGCVGSPTIVAAIVQRNGPAIHFRPGTEPPESFFIDGPFEYIDIAGGGWPERLRTATYHMDHEGDVRYERAIASESQEGVGLFGEPRREESQQSSDDE